MKIQILSITSIVCLSMFSILATSSASAETTFGAKIGPGFSKWRLETDLPTTLERTYRPGMVLGGFLQLRGAHGLSLQFEGAFASRGTEVTDGVDVEHRAFSYFDIAVLGRAEKPIDLVSPYVLAGMVGSYLGKATIGSTDVADSFQRFDYGLRFGAGVSVRPFAWGTVFIEGRYDFGLNDIDKDNDELSFRNRSLSFLLGFEYSLERPQKNQPKDPTSVATRYSGSR